MRNLRYLWYNRNRPNLCKWLDQRQHKGITTQTMHTVRGTRYAGTEEAAKFLGISSQTLRDWIIKGRLPEVEVWTDKGRRSRCFTAAYLAHSARQEKPNTTANDVTAWVNILNIDNSFGEDVTRSLHGS